MRNDYSPHPQGPNGGFITNKCCAEWSSWNRNRYIRNNILLIRNIFPVYMKQHDMLISSRVARHPRFCGTVQQQKCLSSVPDKLPKVPHWGLLFIWSQFLLKKLLPMIWILSSKDYYTRVTQSLLLAAVLNAFFVFLFFIITFLDPPYPTSPRAIVRHCNISNLATLFSSAWWQPVGDYYAND